MRKEDDIALEELLRILKKLKKERVEIQKDPITRHKNFEFIKKYQLIDDDIKEIIKSLTKENYVKGPEEDRNINYSHPVWVFIKLEKKIRIEIYIKFKLIHSRSKIVVISFHEEGNYEN